MPRAGVRTMVGDEESARPPASSCPSPAYRDRALEFLPLLSAPAPPHPRDPGTDLGQGAGLPMLPENIEMLATPSHMRR